MGERFRKPLHKSATKMKIPNIFVPGTSLEKKIKQFLKRDYTSPKAYENLVNEKKRKILIYSKDPVNLPPGGIYVRIKNPMNKGEYFMDLYSTSEFYFPVCNNPIDWGARNRKKSTAYLKTEEGLINYFKLLEEGNDAVLKWEENYQVRDFKERFDETYKKRDDIQDENT